MEIRNRTPWDVRVSTDVLSSEWIVVEVTTLVPWTLEGRRLEETVKLRDQFLPDRPLHHLEPDRRHILEVTLCGSLRFTRAVASAELTLQIDDRRLQASLSGPRTWVQAGGRLVPSAATPTLEIDLGWGNALGGYVRRPPGLVPFTNLPSPSFEESWSENPAGVGFYGRPAEAEGRAVPGIEHVDAKSLSYDALGRSWSFAGLPVGTSFALEHLEADGNPSAKSAPPSGVRSKYPEDPSPRARLSCKAPPWLRFDAARGVRQVACRVDGASVFDLRVPPLPFHFEVRAGTRMLRRPSTLVWLELDLELGRAHGLCFSRLFCPYVRGQQRSVTLVGGELERDAAQTSASPGGPR